jgi:hypothetical protein
MLWRIPADTHEQRIGTMFNLPTNIRLPGFRVGLPDDPPGLNTETVPGFAVPALGYDPDGNAIQTAQATGLGSASFDPQGLVPVNCTSADGSTAAAGHSRQPDAQFLVWSSGHAAGHLERSHA